jgi:hypothetical protein
VWKSDATGGRGVDVTVGVTVGVGVADGVGLSEGVVVGDVGVSVGVGVGVGLRVGVAVRVGVRVVVGVGVRVGVGVDVEVGVAVCVAVRVGVVVAVGVRVGVRVGVNVDVMSGVGVKTTPPFVDPLTSYTPPPVGRASTTTNKRNVPACETFIRKLTSIVASVGKGAICVTGAERLLLKPPPLACVGGSSSVSPLIETLPPPHGVASIAVTEVVAARIAVDTSGAGDVVTSKIRKRRRVTFPPVLFVNLRRSESVPLLPLPVRTPFGAVESETHGATGEGGIVAARLRGLVRFSGPGAPSEAVARLAFALVAIVRKSVALFPVSVGRPVSGSVFRTMLNSTEASATGE